MNASAILNNLYRRGVSLRADGDVIRWQAPTGVMTEADLSALRQSKPEVLAIIREEESDRIIQFDAYLARREAERRARNEQHPANGGNAA